jgi:RHS repeat-associated protein
MQSPAITDTIYMNIYITNTSKLLRPTLLLVLITVCCNLIAQQPVPGAYDPAAKLNYIRTWVMKAPETTEQGVVTRPLKDVARTTQYIDGLGRPVQTVVKQGALETGAAAVDLVSPVVYDQYGRETSKYLSFKADATGGNMINNGVFKTNPFQQQAAFMSAQYGSQGETFFYGQSVYETSPLNRPIKELAPGNSWVGSNRGVTKGYLHNDVAESALRMWNIEAAAGSLPIDGGIYPSGRLTRNTTYDEHNNLSFEYIDKSGKLVVKSYQNGSEWLITYYVYDKLGNLRCVIPPQAVPAIWSNWTMTQPVMDELCFRYEYDQRNRMIVKKVPGAGEVRMVYDARDRLVMTQDANMRTPSQQKWMYTTYDALNRPVSTGLLTDPNYNNHGLHLSAAYSSIAYPNLASYTYEELTRTFYDNYDWLSSNGNPFTQNRNADHDDHLLTPSTAYPYPQAMTQSFATKGMVTGAKIKVIGTGTYLYSINYYDVKRRVLQTISQNMAGSWDVVTTQYDFSDKVLVKTEKSSKYLSTERHDFVRTVYEYDDLGRVTNIKKTPFSYFGGTWKGGVQKEIVRNEYDALGQLKKKKLAPAYNNNAGLETENFEYNIRGWMLGMNRDYAKDVSTTNYFGFDLGYDKANNNIIAGQTYTTPQYNGNIEGMVWKSKGSGEKRKYDFSYDAVNRLMKADFNQFTNSSFNKQAGVDFTVIMGNGTDPSSAYDLNGNIKWMQQWGLKITGSVQVDNLRYTYQSTSNKLRSVVDFNNDIGTLLGDFKTNPTHPQSTSKSALTLSSAQSLFDAIADYTYDVNGNLKKDLNKDIGTAAAEDIVYNHLNLPQSINVRKADGNIKGTITYTYDAAGNKLKKEVTETGQPLKTTLYIGGSVYENDVFQFIGMEEGRIRFRPSDNTFQYDYMLKDHLGNVRMVLTEETLPTKIYQATIEDANRAAEVAVFTQIGDTESPSKPSGFDSDVNNLKVTKLFNTSGTGNDKRTGPGIVLKVMAGDKFKALAQGWYLPGGTTTATLSGANSIVDNIIAAITGGMPAGASHNGQQVGGAGVLNSPLNQFITYQNDPLQYNSARPKAFLNWIVLDEEQFKKVDGNYGAVQIPEITGVMGKQVMQAAGGTNIEVKKNGYLYVYVSNESQGSVYFDDIRIEHTRGPLLEETHYYPFGLTMAGISSKALNFGDPANKLKYNGIEKENDLNIEIYDAQLRELDGQTGRWWQIDPKIEKMEMWSPYASNYDNPIRYKDPLGDSPDGCCDGLYKTLVSAAGTLNGAAHTMTFGLWPKDPMNWAADNLDEEDRAVYFGSANNASIATTVFSMGAPSLASPSASLVPISGPQMPLPSFIAPPAFPIPTTVQSSSAGGEKKTPNELGKEGLQKANVEQNTTRIPSASGKAQYRIPDGLTSEKVTEVKNRVYVPWNSQLKDYLHFAENAVPKRTFELVVRPGEQTKLAPSLQHMVDVGRIKLTKFPL